MLQKAKNNEAQVFFLDGAHLAHTASTSVLWSVKRLFVKACSGRSRFNILGALNAVTKEMIYIGNDTTINRWTVVDLFRKIKNTHPEGEIFIFLDNARYQRCYATQSAANMNINLIYLPSYSLNLNLIEKVWKFIRSKCLNSKYYSSFKEHCSSTEKRIENFTGIFKEELKNLLTWNFQVLKNESVMPF